MLGQVRRFQADAGDELAHGMLAVAQELEDLDAGGVGQGPKQLCPDLVNGTGNLSPPEASAPARWEDYTPGRSQESNRVYNFLT